MTGRGRKIMSNNDLEAGSTAPEFKLPSNTNSEIKLADYQGKKIILFFVREYN
jgi:peroxiredoxin